MPAWSLGHQSANNKNKHFSICDERCASKFPCYINGSEMSVWCCLKNLPLFDTRLSNDMINLAQRFCPDSPPHNFNFAEYSRRLLSTVSSWGSMQKLHRVPLFRAKIFPQHSYRQLSALSTHTVAHRLGMVVHCHRQFMRHPIFQIINTFIPTFCISKIPNYQMPAKQYVIATHFHKYKN